MNTLSSPSVRRLNWVDALRGVAALAVMFFHGRQTLWIGLTRYRQLHPNEASFNSLLAHATLPIHFGYAGVQLFFVLSGYCIHARAARDGFLTSSAGLGAMGWRDFWVRRFFRLYPAYLAATLFTVGCALLLDGRAEWGVAAGNLLFLQNLVFPLIPYNDPFWSLAVEVQLYLLYPILILLARRFSLGTMLLLTGMVCAAANVAELWPSKAFGLLLTLSAWFPWAIGMTIAEWHHRGQLRGFRTRLWVGLALASALLAMVCHWRWPGKFGQDPLWGATFGVVLAWGLGRFEDERWHRFPPLRFLAFCGMISYSLYLFHRPFLFLLRAGYERWMGAVPDHLGLFAVGAALTLLVSWLAYWAIEHPGIQFGKRWQPPASP